MFEPEVLDPALLLEEDDGLLALALLLLLLLRLTVRLAGAEDRELPALLLLCTVEACFGDELLVTEEDEEVRGAVER